MNEKEWIAKQGKCCVVGCHESPVIADNMDNVFCLDCAEKDQEETPENWE